MRNGYGYSELFSVFARANRGWLRRGWRVSAGRIKADARFAVTAGRGIDIATEGVIQAEILV